MPAGGAGKATRWGAKAVVLLLLAVPGRVWGQMTAPPPGTPVEWHLFVGDDERPWPLSDTLPLDSLEGAGRRLLVSFQREGYYFADMGSVEVDRERVPVVVRMHVIPGPRVTVGRVRITGMTAFDSLAVRQNFDTRPGRLLDPLRLEADLEAVLTRYEQAGLPLAQIRLETLGLLPGDPPRLDLLLQVDEGRGLTLKAVALPGAVRTRPAYAARVAGLVPGQPLVAYAPDDLRRRLEETGFFTEVSTPELLIDPEGGVILQIPVREASPGAFDLVLGYLPPAGTGGSGSIVGNGHLELRNIFGAGRVMSLTLNRLPGQVSSVDARLADPFLFGLPFGGEGRFEGLQQDSTYGKQRYLAELSYRFGEGLHAFVTVSRESTSPGPGGLALRNGRQRIPRADALFAGLGVRYRQVDAPVNPRRGFLFEMNFERGRKERTARVLLAGADTTVEGSLLRQQRLQARTRFFVPTARRQVLALGGEGAVLLSDEYDESDLFRFGGARSLRGYDEERFRGRVVARLFTEYRYRIDRQSYAYLFFDLGYVDRPPVASVDGAREVHPGFGLGIQFSTNLGLVNASYAMNNEDGPTNGRIHVGLSFGL